MSNKALTYAQALVDALDGASNEKASLIAKRFYRILKQRRDLRLAGKILSEFDRLIEQKDGITGKVVTAQGLSEEARNEVRSVLNKGGYSLKEEVSPDVIGGMAAFLGESYLVDGTVKAKVAKMMSAMQEK